jgi:hypothetical protein
MTGLLCRVVAKYSPAINYEISHYNYIPAFSTLLTLLALKITPSLVRLHNFMKSMRIALLINAKMSIKPVNDQPCVLA